MTLAWRYNHLCKRMIIRATQALSIGIFAATGMAVGDRIDETTHIKLGSALAVACVVVPGVWWLSSWMRGITDSLSELRGKVDNLQCVRSKVCTEEKKKG
jgi:hypothetical protein